MAVSLWLGLSLYLCTLGFGADPDAWLMAQTAEKLRLGFGYDPARSAGNPLYEFLLIVLQKGQQSYFSNLVNLTAACLVLWRLPIYFSDNSNTAFFRLMLMVLPWFLEAATSSMETILALWFWLEAGLNMERRRSIPAWFFLMAASFTRPEYFLLISLQDWRFWKQNLPFWLLGLVCILAYLIWVQGINPVPFHDLNSMFWFYGGRIFTLFQDGKVVLIFTLFFASTVWKSADSNKVFTRGAWVNIVVFCLFPFEWAYLLPFMVAALSRIQSRWKLTVLALSIALPFLHFTLGFHVEFNSPWADRILKKETFRLAQKVDFQEKTILLYGATWLPTDVHAWKKLMQNRLFHRSNSNFYVGEKISSSSELDSLHNSGYQIVAWKDELGDFKMQSGKAQIPQSVQLIEDVELFLKQNLPDQVSIRLHK